FTLNLTFGLDPGGVFVDPTQNNAGSPLLNLVVTADLKGFSGVAADLNGIPVQVTDSSQSPSQLNIPVSFDASAKAPIHGFSAASLDQIDVASNASADVNLHDATTAAHALALTLDLGVHWPLTSTKPGVGPFDALSDGQVPTVALNAGADLNSLAAVLN